MQASEAGATGLASCVGGFGHPAESNAAEGGTGIVSAPVPRKLLMMAGTDDHYTSARSCTATLGNFVKATFDAISKTYNYQTPDLWKETVFTKSPYQEFTDHLVKTHTRVSMQRTQA
ncbi:40S ribosomal protein S2 [Tupaia chinensis]|uniref:Small ribosomal subunit protein uS5 n=1 Tax=Tupaia chinensis TaxID=246437 RepID=L9K6I1_TUPCH|nr:40S ribosomal protein S2 [Tupaia chinensis]